MAARSGMADIITFVREKVNDKGSDIWTDDQIQAACDVYRCEHRYASLTPVESRAAGGAIEYLNYDGPSYLESDATIYDGQYGALTANSVDYFQSRFTFTADTNQPVYLLGWEHDPYAAAAELLEELAATKADSLQSFSGANGSFAYAGKAAGLRKQVDRYKRMSKIGTGSTVDLIRTDTT